MTGGQHVLPRHRVTAMPAVGDVVLGRDATGRVLRISGHPDSDRIVLSVWQHERCVATVRLAPEDVPGVLAALGDALDAVRAG